MYIILKSEKDQCTIRNFKGDQYLTASSRGRWMHFSHRNGTISTMGLSTHMDLDWYNDDTQDYMKFDLEKEMKRERIKELKPC